MFLRQLKDNKHQMEWNTNWNELSEKEKQWYKIMHTCIPYPNKNQSLEWMNSSKLLKI